MRVFVNIVCILVFSSLFSGCIDNTDNSNNKGTHPANKYLVITIDVEAQPPRQSDNHVERLVYGNFSEGRVGIIEMMDAADMVGAKLTFFVDVLEEFLYPNEIRQVLRDIDNRGHNIQLHSHPEYVPSQTWEDWQNESRWQELGAEKIISAGCWNEGTAEFILGKMIDILNDEGIEKPIAYRGGGLRFNAETLNVMTTLGIYYSYNYNPPSSHQLFDVGKQPIFQWSNGVNEIPISYMPSDDGGIDISKRFDESYWNTTNLSSLINSYFDAAKGDTVLVMIMHSWSLLGKAPDETDGSHNFIYDGEWRKEAFQQFLQNLPEDITVISASELAGKIDSGDIYPYQQFHENLIQTDC